MANKNFEVKHGLSVGGTERITAAGAGSLTNLTLSGNLTVQGTTVTLDASTLQVADKNIVLNYHASNDTSSAANGAGITIQDAVDGSNDATLTWDTSLDKFDLSHGLHIGDSAAIGTTTTPALQIGGTTTYRLGLYTSAEGGVIENKNGDDGLQFKVKTAGESMRIDGGTGNVGIGTASPAAKLHVANAATEEYIFETTSNNTRSQVEVKSKDSSGNAVQTRLSSMGDGAYGMLYTLTNHNLTFGTNNAAPQMNLDTSGKLGISTTASLSGSDYGMLTIKKTGSNIFGDSAITINSADTNQSTLALGLTSSLAYVDSTESGSGTVLPLVFATGSAERMRISPSGGVEIGDGTNYGYVKVINDSAVVQYLDRRGSDGVVLEIRHADSKDGQINTLSGRMAVGSGDTGIFFDSTRDCLSPFSMTSNDGRGDLIDIGRTGVKFRDLHLSGTGYFGTSVQIADSAKLVTKTTNGEVIRFERAGDSLRYSSIHANSTDAGGAFIQFKVHTGASATSLADVMTLKGSGNVGIGTTTAADRLHISGGNILLENALELRSKDTGGSVRTITRVNSSNELEYGWSGAGPVKFMGGGSYTERMRIHTNGNIGIGTNAPVSELDIFNSTSPTISLGYNGGGGNGGTIDWNLNVVSSPLTAQIKAIDDGNYRMNMIFSTKTSASASSGMSERMRITSAGSFIIGNTAEPTGSNGGGSGFITDSAGRKNLILATTSTSLIDIANFRNPNGTVGTIRTNGSSTSYYTSSDYRLKENVVTDWDATTRLKQLKPSRFNFIADGDTTLDGFLAHEVQDIVPEATHGTKDELDSDGNPEYQGIDHAKLVPLLTKALQELEARITDLEG